MLFHNLWRDDETGHYFQLLDDGRTDPVVYFEDGRMLVRTDLLHQFQAARQWDLVLWIDSRRLRLSAPGVDMEAIRTDVVHDLDNTCLVGGSGHSVGGFTRFYGVRVVPAPPFEQAGTIGFGDSHSETFPELIFHIDEDGADVRMACGQLWNFQVHGAAPGLLFAHLGDFGQELPEAERKRWAGFNHAPARSGITDPLRRELAASPIARRGIDFEFQRRYRSLNEAWHRRFGWALFTEPTGDDVHLMKRVRVPLNDGAPEFEEQLGVLARLVVDSIDSKALSKAVGAGTPNEKSISKLERFLGEQAFEEPESAISVLRDLQDLRSKVAAHKKSSKVDAVVQSTLETTDPVAGIMRILIRLCEAMERIEDRC